MKLENPEIHNLNFRSAKFWRCSSILLFVFFIVVSPSQTYGKTLEKYRAEITDAKLSVESLIYPDDDEMSETEYAGYERRTLAKIRAVLPAVERIEWQGTIVETNNEWLTDKLDEFEKEPQDSTKREEILTEVSERLEAIEQKLDEAATISNSARAKDEDKQKLAEILRREEYTKPEEPKESLFQRWWRKLKQLLADMFPPQNLPVPDATGFQSFSFVLQMILYALVLGVIGFLIYRFAPFLAQIFKSKERSVKGERVILGERLSENETAQNLLEEAERLAGEGNLRGAIRKAYIAALCELSDRKVISLARHKTNRDYLRDVGKQHNIYENMTGLTANFERHWYGSDSVEETDWNEFRQGYIKVTGGR